MEYCRALVRRCGRVSARPVLFWATGVLALLTVPLLLLVCLRVSGQANSAGNEYAQTLQANIGVMEFVMQSRLSPQEQQEVASDVAASVKTTPPQKVEHVNNIIAITLRNAAQNPADAPRLRELWRYDIANLTHDDVEYQIVERHDPTLVLDKAHQRIITETTLTALRACTVWLMGNLHKPSPGPDFIASERATLRSSYWHLGDDEQDAYAHVERNCPHAQQFFAGTAAAQRAHFFEQNAKAVTNSQSAGKDAALISRIAYRIQLRRGGAAQGRLFDYMIHQSLLNHQLERTIIPNAPLPPPN